MKLVWQSKFSAQRQNSAACARVAARYPERWLRHYAASKLRRDPIFSVAADFLRESQRPLLDLGCGVGLLPFYLRECGFTPAITAVEFDARKVQRARAASDGRNEAIDFREGDVNDGLPAFSGSIVIFDLLHYLEPDQQTQLLQAVAARLAPGGILLIRDAPRELSLRFHLTRFAEIFAQAITWNMRAKMHFPTRE